MWIVTHDPPDGPPVSEGFVTEVAAEARADWLRNGKRFQRVAVFEIADGEEVA